jgi:GTP-binding protein Era
MRPIEKEALNIKMTQKVIEGRTMILDCKVSFTYAREDLEKMFGTKVYLNLWVKVKENWRESARTVSNFGYRDEE